MAEEKTTTGQPGKDNATAADAGQSKDQVMFTQSQLDAKDQAMFTQSQLDAIVRDRLERATQKTTADLLGQLGIEDIETAKNTLSEAQKAREAQMSELEKAQAQIAELEAQSEAARAEAEAIRARADEALLKSAIVAKAGGFNDPMDAWQFVDKGKIEASEDGSYKGIEDALKALAEAKPYLVKSGDGSGGGTPTQSGRMRTIAERLLDSGKSGDVKPQRPRINF